MKTYYLDTAVLRDYYENRGGGLKSLGEFAFLFFKKCKEENFMLLYSDLTLKELSAYYSKERTNTLIKLVSEFCELKKVETTKKQVDEAKSLKLVFKVPVPDILHAVLARDNSAIIVTTDKHFKKLEKIVEVKVPQELI